MPEPVTTGDGQGAGNGQAAGAGAGAGSTAGAGATSAASASGASGGAGDQGQGGQQGQGQGQGAGSQGQGGQGGAAGATSGARSFTYPEDRSNWLPPHRAREYSSRVRTLEGQIGMLRQQISALTGVRMPEPTEQDPEAQAIRAQFSKMFPKLAKLESMADKLEKLGGLDPDQLTAASEHHWTTLGHRTLNTLVSEAQKAIGGELSPRAKAMLKSSFGAWLESDEELQLRYTMGDDNLVSDFLKEYRDGILDPYRRTSTTAATAAANRTRNLPRQGGGGAVAGAAAPNRPKPGDANYEDAVHDSGWSRFQANQ